MHPVAEQRTRGKGGIMEVEGIISALEKYLREFIVYLVTFFRPTISEEIYDDHENYNKSVVFAIFSTTIGAYMWSRYILHEQNNTKDIFGLMVDNLLKWVSFGILLYLIIRIFKKSIPIVGTVISVVKVFSVAHVIGIYMAYLAINTVWMFSSEQCEKDVAIQISSSWAYIIELGILWIYLPREVRAMVGPNVGRRKRWSIDIVFLTLLSILVLTPHVVWLSDLPAGQHGCGII